MRSHSMPAANQLHSASLSTARHPVDMTDADARKRHFLKKHSIAFALLRAGADVRHLFEERLHLATEQRPHPCEATQPLVSHSQRPIGIERMLRQYTPPVASPPTRITASASCSRSSSARGHGRLNLPEAMIPTIASLWDVMGALIQLRWLPTVSYCNAILM